MKKEILKIVYQIKENLKDIDNDGIYHPLLDSIYENLSEIEEVISEDDINRDFGLDMGDEFD